MSRYLSIIVIIFVLGLALAGYLVLLPKYNQFKALQLEIKTKDKAIRQKEEYFSKLTELSIKLAKYQPQLDKINIALPKEPSEPSLFNFLQKKSLERGLILQNISSSFVGAEASQDKIKKISFSLNLSGSYLSFKNYLLEIYQNSRLFGIDSISFSSPVVLSPSPSPSSGPAFPFLPLSALPSEEKKFDFSLNLSTFYFQQ